MKIEIEIDDYDKVHGVFKNNSSWIEDANITIEHHKNDKYIYIYANKQGFIELANILLNFAYNDIPEGHHLHLDNCKFGGMLSEKSNDVVIEKIKE